MQILKQKTKISLEEFFQEFPFSRHYLEHVLCDASKEFLDNFKICIDKNADNVPKFSFSWKNFKNIQIDIENELDYHRKYFFKNSPYKEPLARALGLKAGVTKPNVIDLTAGMMGDSLLIYALGVSSLVIWERSPLVALLIEEALKNSDVNIEFHFGEFLKNINESEFLQNTVLYFDPMYQITNKKAAAKKEMIFFRECLGPDLDAKNIAESLVGKASRLVIKRSVKALPLIASPHHSIVGKSTAYDVYLCSNDN